MGLFSKLFNSSSETIERKELPWNNLNSIAQLEDIKEKSSTKTQLIFKYSTRCGINKMVLHQFERDYNFSETDFDLHYLDIFNYRDISNQISDMFQVVHESPQLLVIKDGIVVVHKSHGAINDLDLRQFV